MTWLPETAPGATPLDRVFGLCPAAYERFAGSDLPERWKLVIRWTDALTLDPRGVDDELRAALLAEFTPEEIVELTATITTAIAFSKAAVVFGAPPEMPVLEVPTPGVEE